MAARHTLAALGALGVLALALWLTAGGRSSGSGTGAPAAAPPAAPAGAPPVALGAAGEHQHRRGDDALAAVGALRLRLTPALARAYAAAGALRDGRRHDLAGLDPTTLAELGHAEELLAYATARPGQRLATRMADGTTMQIGSGPAPPAGPAAGGSAGSAGSAGSGPGVTTGSSVRRDDGGATATTGAPAATSPGAAELPDGAVASSLSAQDHMPIPISGQTTKQLTLPDAWLAIPYQPAQVNGQPLVIVNSSGGEYAISLLCEDFGEVRLDGGLVVPGRYYRINGRTTITSTVPVGVHIRPLNAVGPYYDQPLIMPSADG
jgi:hypothetical protein